MGIRELACIWVLAGCFDFDPDGTGGGGGPRPDARGSEPRPDACVPTTCIAQGASCGSIDDGCGGTLDCGGCAGQATCGGQGVPNVCALPVEERLCADGWCWEGPEPFSFVPRAVFALSPTDAWVVGERGTVMRFDGTRWRPVPSNTTADLNDIWMASASDGWLVGAGGVIRRWNGTAWTAVASGTSADLRGVWGAAANDVWIVGDKVTRRWTGSALTTPAVTTPSLQDVFATGSNVFAVGEGFVWQFSVAAWSKRTGDAPLFTSYTLTNISGTATEAYALGRSRTITSGEDLGYRWDGQSWTRHADPGDPEWTDVFAIGNDLYGVSDESITHLATTMRIQGPGGDMVAAAGANGNIFVATRPSLAGQLYRRVTGPWVNDAGFGTHASLFAVTRIGDDLWFAGASGTVIEWRGGAVVHDLPTTRDLIAIAGTARDNVWVADELGYTYRFDGERWQTVLDPAGRSTALAAVGGEILLVGSKIYRRTDDWWAEETVAADAPSWLAAAEHAGDLYVAGTLSGTPSVARIARRTGGTWSELPAPALERICGIAVVSPDDIWGAGHDSASPANGAVAHFNGTTWTVETLAGAGKLCAIAAHAGEVWVTGEGTALYRRSAAGTWTTAQPLAAGSLRALRATGDALWAVGDHGAVLRRD